VPLRSLGYPFGPQRSGQGRYERFIESGLMGRISEARPSLAALDAIARRDRADM
jgi:hypothetical protein